MARLYDLTSEMRDLWDKIDATVDETGEIPQELAAQLSQLETDIKKKFAACCVVRAESLADAEMFSKELARLSAKKRAAERKAEWIQNYMQQCMQDIGTNEVVCEGWKVKIQNSQPAVFVTDETKIPEKFFAIEKKLLKAVVKEFINDGEPVPGCELRAGSFIRVY